MKQVTIDRSAMAGVRRVALPTAGFPSSPSVGVINGIGKQFGAIGLISTAIVQSNRSDALAALMAKRGFDPRSVFQSALAAHLQALRLTVMAEPADGSRSGFIKDVTVPAGDNALLDVAVRSYGFFAFSDSDSSPYRPGLSLDVRLVGADGSVLMQDKILNTGIDALVGKGPAAAVPPSFTTFSDVTANPELAVSALRLAFDYAADAVTDRLA